MTDPSMEDGWSSLRHMNTSREYHSCLVHQEGNSVYLINIGGYSWYYSHGNIVIKIKVNYIILKIQGLLEHPQLNITITWIQVIFFYFLRIRLPTMSSYQACLFQELCSHSSLCVVSLLQQEEPQMEQISSHPLRVWTGCHQNP